MKKILALLLALELCLSAVTALNLRFNDDGIAHILFFHGGRNAFGIVDYASGFYRNAELFKELLRLIFHQFH